MTYLYARPRAVVHDAIDFRSFFCAARVVSWGRSPYLAQPLRTCEASTSREAGMETVRDLTLPAPLPGYAFALLIPLAKMPYLQANVTYDLILIIATILSVTFLIHLTRLPYPMIIAGLAIGEAFQSLRFGEIVPIVLTLVILASLMLERGKHWGAACALGGAMIEPHVTLPALLGLLLYVPRSRIPLFTVALILASLCLITIGPQQSVLYLTRVLPAHAHAEIHLNSYQFSLTNLLHQIGIADHLALTLGCISYVGMIVAGIAVSRVLATRTSRPSLLILGPCAWALLGGPFVHLVQIVCALPFAFLLLACGSAPLQNTSGKRADGRTAPWQGALIIATILLAVPWLEIARAANPMTVAAVVALITLPIAWYGITLNKTLSQRTAQRRTCTLAAGMAALGIAVTLIWQAHPAPPRHQPDTSAILAPVQDGRLLAEVSWEAYVQTRLSANEERYILAKLPTWIGLLLLLAAAARMATDPIQDKHTTWA